MTFARIARGNIGESLADSFLKKMGYRILEKNYRTRFGEIDIIGNDNGCIAFIEVRARSGGNFGRPEESIGPRKQNQIARSALMYIKSRRLENEDCRFDVVCVENVNSRSPEIRLIKNAFGLNARYRY